MFSSNSFRVFALTCLTLICFELLFICSEAVVVQFLPRGCSYPAAPPPFVEETVLSSSNGLSAFVKNQSAIDVQISGFLIIFCHYPTILITAAL